MSLAGCLDVQLLNAQTVDEKTSEAVDVKGATQVAVYVTGAGTLASGVVTIEEAPERDYAGTWSTITTVAAADVTGGQTIGVHMAAGSSAFIRTRISTVVAGGGTISTRLVAS